MGELCEFEIDFEQFDDLRAVVVHDECGAHEDVWFYRFDGLRAENAKLRELVHTIFYCMQQERDCDGCAMNGAEGAITEHVGCDGLREVLRELGIEAE